MLTFLSSFYSVLRIIMCSADTSSQPVQPSASMVLEDDHLYVKRPRLQSAKAMQLLLGSDNTEDTVPESLSAEFSNYFQEPLVPLTHDPLSWWKENSHRYHHLSMLAQRYLCLPATSVPAERVFSIAGLVVNCLRTRLSPDHVDMLIFSHKNLYKTEECCANEDSDDN